jgi:hypothetical protein
LQKALVSILFYAIIDFYYISILPKYQEFALTAFTKITNNYNNIKNLLPFYHRCGKIGFDKQKCKHI